MINIIDTLRNKPFLFTQGGASVEAISSAEAILGSCFADDYREYLKEFGVASYQGHELTGISDVARLSVTEITPQLRDCHSEVCHGWYVVENTQIDGIVIWQSPNGSVYQSSPGQMPVQIASSFVEYVSRH